MKTDNWVNGLETDRLKQEKKCDIWYKIVGNVAIFEEQ